MAAILKGNESVILNDWMKQQAIEGSLRGQTDDETQAQSRDFLSAFTAAAQKSYDENLSGSHWDDVRNTLSTLSKNRAIAGSTPAQTATFVFSLKKPLFARLRKDLAGDPQALGDEMWNATVLLDELGLYTTEMYQKSREQVIQQQQRELMELSTPVVELWEGVLALPLIGTLDSGRTQLVMEALLQRIVETGSALAIIDITGVPTVDTLVAQHLLKTVTAIRLMGADAIISGIRPQIAQTIVHLGIDLEGITTKATLADALSLALKRVGYTVTRSAKV